ncbi:hypothetical protein CJ030_MR2G024393 [Morella rubra]|uniref:Uncharacterized protein n=1 Tax=Morella rubra TaxID=262757 RepID=A0A6A1WFZ9_9ROSI|nr:hypothetical protein CJ030_MR2G024393 [Morella rubra]
MDRIEVSNLNRQFLFKYFVSFLSFFFLSFVLVLSESKFICLSGEISKAMDVTRADEALAIAAKGFKTRELKHRDNKRLKSAIELRKKSRLVTRVALLQCPNQLLATCS